MAYKVIDHGFWRPYTPDPLPEWAAAASTVAGPVLFLRRDDDNVDWYAFVKSSGQFYEGSVLALTVPGADPGVEMVGAIFRDETKLVPFNQRVIEILGVDPAEEKPHNLFEWLSYHPDTQTFSGEAGPPQPPRLPEPWERVSATQAKIQLSRMKRGDTNLLAMTEQVVAASQDIELQIWFRDARNWAVDSPNVLKIGVAFGLTREEIQAAFEAASKIEE